MPVGKPAPPRPRRPLSLSVAISPVQSRDCDELAQHAVLRRLVGIRIARRHAAAAVGMRAAPASCSATPRRARRGSATPRSVSVDLLENLIVDRDRRREIAAAEAGHVLDVDVLPWKRRRRGDSRSSLPP